MVRTEEAADIAALVTAALHERWCVTERHGSTWSDRPIRPKDITILLPYRTAILALESALDEVGVPYRTEAASIVYSAPEVRELLTCLRAVDDPTDELAVVATLRSSLFGCSDADLWRWRAAGGRWSLFRASIDGRRGVCPGHVCASGPALGRGRRRPSCSKVSSNSAACWRSPSIPLGTARCGADCASSSTRPGRGRRPSTGRCGSTCGGPRGRPRTRRASPSRFYPRTTPNRCGSPPSMHRRASSSRSSSSRDWRASGRNRRPTVLWPARRGHRGAAGGRGFRDLGVRRGGRRREGDRAGPRGCGCSTWPARGQRPTWRCRVHRKAPPANPKPDRVAQFAELLAEGCATSVAFTSPSLTATPWSAPPRAAAAPLPTWSAWSAAHETSVTSSAEPEAASATDIAHGRVRLPSFPPGLAKDPWTSSYRRGSRAVTAPR